jgi:hypothetical protein
MTPIPASKQVEQLSQQLLQAYIKKHDAETQRAQAEEQITAIRNLMAGVPIGQKLQTEMTAQAATPLPTP